MPETGDASRLKHCSKTARSFASCATMRPAHGVTFDNVKVDFGKVIGRSRTIADKLAKGIGSLFHKYGVKSELGTAQLLAPHRVKVTTKEGTKEITADHIIIAVGAKGDAVAWPSVRRQAGDHQSRSDGRCRRSRKRMAIIGAGAIGCEFADFYKCHGHRDRAGRDARSPPAQRRRRCGPRASIAFSRSARSTSAPKTKTDKVEVTSNGVKLTLLRCQAGRRGGRRRARRDRRHRQRGRCGRSENRDWKLLKKPGEGDAGLSHEPGERLGRR